MNTYIFCEGGEQIQVERVGGRGRVRDADEDVDHRSVLLSTADTVSCEYRFTSRTEGIDYTFSSKLQIQIQIQALVYTDREASKKE
jgi:hypothetical protein